MNKRINSQSTIFLELRWLLFANLLFLTINYNYAQQTNAVAPTINVKIALVIIDPTIPANNNATFRQSFGWNDAQSLTNQTISSLKTASKGVVDYTIVETHRPNKLFSKNRDQSEVSPNQLFEEVRNLSSAQIEALKHNFDYEAVLAAYNFCDKVNADIIDEVWIYAPPFVGMYGSRMTGQNAFWINGPTFSSSCVELLPIMGLNYERGVAEALHSYGYRVENVIRQVYGSWNAQSCEGHNFQKFTAYDQICSGNAQVGNINFPPNGTSDFDYDNTNFVTTSAYSWADYPNLGNDVRTINCQTWNCTALGYMEWWFDKLPNFDCLNLTDGTLNNWWHYIVDYNDAMRRVSTLNNSNCGQIIEPECTVTWSTDNGSIRIEGLTAPHVIFKLFNPDWSIHSQCFDNCTDPLSITGLVAGEIYHVSYSLYNASWQLICSDIQDVQVAGNGGNLADLTLDNLRISPSGKSGEIVNYSFNLNNVGVVTASPNYVINAYLSSDTQLTAEDVWAGEVRTGNTPVGTISAVPGAITVPNIAAGTYYLILVADSDDVVAESNNNNNTAITTFTITSAAGHTGIPLACNLNYTFDNGNLSIAGEGLNSGHVIIKIFGPTWNTLYTCLDDCGSTINIPNLARGTYHISIDLYQSEWQSTCRELVRIELGNSFNDPAEESVRRASLLNSQNQLSFQAYPSPTEGTLSVQFPILPNPATLSVSNLFGQEILKQVISASLAPGILTLDMSDYQNGIYYLELRTKGQRGLQKIIKQDMQ